MRLVPALMFFARRRDFPAPPGTLPPMDLEATVTELAPGLLRYCRGQLAPALAEEVAQEALAALVARWRGTGPPESPAAFVFSIARRRSARVAWRARLAVPLAAVSLGALPWVDAVSSVETRSELAQARRLLARLSAREREALLLVAVAGLPLAEAARTLDIGESALKMRLARARQRLAKLAREARSCLEPKT